MKVMWLCSQDTEWEYVCAVCMNVCAVLVCLFICVSEGVCVKCLLYVLNHICTKVRALSQRVCCVCVSRQPAEQGEHLHTVAQAFCLYTRLLPSNASRPSRL